MPLIYITGISGSGKTTVRNELRRQGYQAFGTDEDQLAFFYNNQTGKPPHEFEILLNWQKTAREDYQKLGAIIIDATQPVEAVVDDILAKIKIIQKHVR